MPAAHDPRIDRSITPRSVDVLSDQASQSSRRSAEHEDVLYFATPARSPRRESASCPALMCAYGEGVAAWRGIYSSVPNETGGHSDAAAIYGWPACHRPFDPEPGSGT